MTASEDKALRERCEAVARHYVTEWDGDEEDVYTNMLANIEAVALAAWKAGYDVAREQAAVIAYPYYLADKIRAMQPAPDTGTPEK